MQRINVKVIGRYSGASATVRAAVKQTIDGVAYLEISKRQIKNAANSCCHGGADYLKFHQISGFSDWHPCDDDSWVAYSK